MGEKSFLHRSCENLAGSSRAGNRIHNMRRSRIVQRHGAANAQNNSLLLQRRASELLEDKFLDAPVEEFGDVEFVFGRAAMAWIQPNWPACLPDCRKRRELFRRAELVDAAGESVRVKRIGWGGRDAESPSAPGDMVPGVWKVACCRCGAGVGGTGTSMGSGGEFSVGVEDLDAAVARSRRRHCLRVGGDAVGVLSWPGLSPGSPRIFRPVAVLSALAMRELELVYKWFCGRQATKPGATGNRRKAMHLAEFTVSLASAAVSATCENL